VCGHVRPELEVFGRQREAADCDGCVQARWDTALELPPDEIRRCGGESLPHLVGVLSGSLEDLGEQRFVEALGRGLGRHDLHMLVADARGEPERELALARRLGDQWVDGLIVSALDPSAALWEQLGEALPVVAVGDALGGRTVGQVLFDNRAGVR